MTALDTRPATSSVRQRITSRSFVVHYLQMWAAMGLGMLVFGSLAMMLTPDLGIELDALLMATWMNLGMVVWMAWRRHPVRSVVEMCAAMYLSFAVLFPLYWAGLMSEGAVMGIGHLLMIPAMAIAMLRDGHHG